MDKVTDYRALLIKYMAHVWDEEGSAFIPWLAEHGFTDAEIAELNEIRDEAEKLNKGRRSGN
jgi:hypothetical protein